MINSKNLTALWIAILLVIWSAGHSSNIRVTGNPARNLECRSFIKH